MEASIMQYDTIQDPKVRSFFDQHVDSLSSPEHSSIIQVFQTDPTQTSMTSSIRSLIHHCAFRSIRLEESEKGSKHFNEQQALLESFGYQLKNKGNISETLRFREYFPPQDGDPYVFTSEKDLTQLEPECKHIIKNCLPYFDDEKKLKDLLDQDYTIPITKNEYEKIKEADQYTAWLIVNQISINLKRYQQGKQLTYFVTNHLAWNIKQHPQLNTLDKAVEALENNGLAINEVQGKKFQEVHDDGYYFGQASSYSEKERVIFKCGTSLAIPAAYTELVLDPNTQETFRGFGYYNAKNLFPSTKKTQ